MSLIAAARQSLPALADYSDEEIVQKMAQINGLEPGSKPYKEFASRLLGYDRSMGDVAKDSAVQLGQGVLNVGKSAVTIATSGVGGINAFGNEVTQGLGTMANAMDLYKSKGLRNQMAGGQVNSDIAARTAAAEGRGFAGTLATEAGAQLENYRNAPGLIAQDVVTNLPQLAVGGLSGRAAQIGAKALGLGAKTAGRVGLATALGSGGAMQGADIGSDTYARALAAGASEEEATSIATKAAFKAGAASIALSLLPGAANIEKSMLAGSAGSMAKRGLGRVGAVARTVGTEMGTEAVDEGYGQFAANQGIQQLNPNQNLASGVGSAAVQGAAASGPLAAMSARHLTQQAPRTETGEINLTGTPVAPTQLDEPTFQRRGLDPLNERSSRYDAAAALKASQAAAAAAAAAPANAQQGQGTIVVDSNGTALPAQSADQMQRTEQYRQFNEGIPTLTDVLAPSDGIPVLNDKLAPADGIPVLNDVIKQGQKTGPVPDIPTLTERLTPPAAPAAPAAAPNRGQLLAALQQANKELAKNVVRKDGELAGTRANAPLAEVMAAADPMAKMRELYQDGNNLRDELLDVWHKNLTGKTIAEAAGPATNSAGFVPEPASQVAAQLAAVKDGRKQAAVLGTEEAAAANTKGLTQTVATGPDGATAVVVSANPDVGTQAAARAQEVGLKQAMGEVLGVANPTLTTEANPDAQVVQQVDNKTGEVIQEELATPADLENIAEVPGTTARVVSADEALAARQSGTAAPAPVIKVKKRRSVPKYGRKTVDEVIDIAESSKDETEYNEARYELFKRWGEGDAQAEAYLTDKKNRSNLTAAEKADFTQRQRGEQVSKKFGPSDSRKTEIRESGAANPENGVDVLTEAIISTLTDGPKSINWLASNAKNAWHRQVAKLIAPYITNEVGVHFVGPGDLVTGDVARRLNGNANAVAVLNGKDGTYELFFNTGRGTTETTLLHELVHAATMKALTGKNNIAFRNEMRGLLNTIRASFRDQQYKNPSPKSQQQAEFFASAMIDENELLAYAFSSPTLRAWMQNMNASGNFLSYDKQAKKLRERAENRAPGVPPLTTFQKFTDAIRKLFGIPPVNQLAFEKLLADREDTVAGLILADSDTTLYSKLDEFLQTAMDLQASQSAEEKSSGVAANTETVAADSSAFVKPFADTAREAKAAAMAQLTGKEISPKLLSLLTLRQIREQYGRKLPALGPWIDTLMERSSNASKIAAQADRVALGWEQAVKDPITRKALADVLLRASVAEIELDNVKPSYLADLDANQRREHEALRAKLASLSPEAQRTRTEALAVLRQQWEYTRKSLESFINHTVADPELRNARIEDLKKEMGRNRGDYFPLSRFGDRIVTGRNAAKDGRDLVSFHETAAGVDAEVARLKAEGVKRIDVTERTAVDPKNRASTGFMGSLHGLVDGSTADSATKDALHDALQQLYLKSLPELSGAKHMIRRENVEGFSNDALRVFADSVTRGARYASHLDFAPQLQAAMESAESQSRSSEKRLAAVIIGRKDGAQPRVMVVPTGTERLDAVNAMTRDGYRTEFFNSTPETTKEHLVAKLLGATPNEIDGFVKQVEDVVGRTAEGVEDMRAAKALYNHMINLQKSDGEKQGPITELLGQIGYTWFLGFSPAFWAINTLQNPMIGIPHLGAKYGTAATAREMGSSGAWFSKIRMGKLWTDRQTPFSVDWLRKEVAAGRVDGINKSELDMLQSLEDRQILDFTQAMDLTRIGQASSDARYKFMRLAAAGAHHTEVFNRVTFALTAYRLALKSNGEVTHEEAVRRAENDTAAVHFDYSPANKPALMRGNAMRHMFMFQQYRQHSLYWWAKNIKDAVKNEAPGDRQRALKASLLMGVTQLTFAGALGLPFIGAVAFLANMLGADDDNGVPFDFNTWISDAATDLTGSKTAGDVLSKGILTSVGMDIGARVGQGGLLPFMDLGSAKFERNADDKMRAYLFDLAGPLGSIALGIARASESFERGDVVGGLAATTPKTVSDLLKAYSLEMDGLKDKKGQTIATSEAFDGMDIAMQAAGVTPTSVVREKADSTKVSRQEAAMTERKRKISTQFVEAWLRGDQTGMREVVEEVKVFNAAAAKFGDKGFLITGQTLTGAVKDRQNRAMMLALSGGVAQTRRQLMMATRTSGLYDPVTPEAIQENAGNLPGLPGLPGR